MSERQALATIRQNIAGFGAALDKKRAVLAQIAPDLNIDRWLRIVYQSVTRTPKLLNCTPDSVIRSALQAAELSLEPGGARGEAYLVPFGQECTLIIGYRGWVNLFYRSGAVRKVVARCVYEGDEYEEQFGTEEYIRHKPCGNTDPAQIVRAYAIAWLATGETIACSMTTDQIERHRKRSRAANEGPWVTDRAAMCAKTALLGLKSWVPNDERIGKALSAELMADTGDVTTIGEWDTDEARAVDVVDEPEPGASQKLARKLQTGKSPYDRACAAFFALGQMSPGDRHAFASRVLNKSVESFKDLSVEEIERLTEVRIAEQNAPPPPDAELF